MHSSTSQLRSQPGAATDPDADGFSALRIKDVVRETADAVSLTLDVPAACTSQFRYQAGQFLTIQVRVDGVEHRRCYSMSSAPAVEPDLRITIKRDGDGVVSNFLNDRVGVGDELRAQAPEGRFVLGDDGTELVAFAGGSGITPVFSLLRSVLATTSRSVRLFYANRDGDSVIFGTALGRLAENHPDRFQLHRHFDTEHGVVSSGAVRDFLGAAHAGDGRDFYICGPGPFMDTVEATLTDSGVARQRVHVERFRVETPPAAPSDSEEVPEEITIELNRRTHTVPYRAGNTLLQTARHAGLKAPASCETGSCGTCIAQVVEGGARLYNNEALDDDEVADGWVVTCQAVPTGRTVRVVYE